VTGPPLLETVKKQPGVVPNLFRFVANSQAALQGHVALSGALGKGALPAATRERIALAIAEINGCDYCQSAHSYLGKNLAKFDDAEIARHHESPPARIPAMSRSRRPSRAVQTRKESRHAYARMEERSAWQTRITPELAVFIAAQTSIFLATVNAEGQPYIQHRGGPAGFLRVIDDKTSGFADYSGNRQYITQGNLADYPKAHLFLIDYAQRRRVKIWGEARIVEGDDILTAQLMPDGYKARPEQPLLFTVLAWDVNCPQHITQRFEAADVAAALADRDRRIATLKAEVKRLRDTKAKPSSP
jgi:uncharacterized protein